MMLCMLNSVYSRTEASIKGVERMKWMDACTHLMETSSTGARQGGKSSSNFFSAMFILAENFHGMEVGALVLSSVPNWNSSVLIPWNIHKSLVELNVFVVLNTHTPARTHAHRHTHI